MVKIVTLGVSYELSHGGGCAAASSTTHGVPWGGHPSVGCLLVVLQWLRVDAVRQHPTIVVVSAQAELALLVRPHRTVPHTEAPVGHHIPVARKGSLETLPAHFVLALVDPLSGHLRLAGGLVLYVVALAAKCDCVGALLLKLEQPRLAVAPLVPGQPALLFLLELSLVARPDGVLELLSG